MPLLFAALVLTAVVISPRARAAEPEHGLTARGESPAAFGRRCIPPGCVAPRSNTPGILTRRALPDSRIAALGATPDFHHGLLNAFAVHPAGDVLGAVDEHDLAAREIDEILH